MLTKQTRICFHQRESHSTAQVIGIENSRLGSPTDDAFRREPLIHRVSDTCSYPQFDVIARRLTSSIGMYVRKRRPCAGPAINGRSDQMEKILAISRGQSIGGSGTARPDGRRLRRCRGHNASVWP